MSIGEQMSELAIYQVEQLAVTPEDTLNQAAAIYQRAFAEPPYSEEFSSEEAVDALQFILDNDGDLILGVQDDEVVSLAGGYFMESGDYFIEELAVDPEKQGGGLGRRTLKALIDRALDQETELLEICTSSENVRAITLYESEGFVKNNILKVAPHFRVGGALLLDQRVYLTRIEKESRDMEKTTKINRMVIAYPSGNTTAIVLDQMLDSNRQELNDQIMKNWTEKQPDSPEIEQCCFVTLPIDKSADARVEMFGGEFCGNATRSVIQLITDGKNHAGKIEVSGVDRPLDYSMRDGVVDLEMPLPITEGVELTKKVSEGTLVQLDGIAHVVVTDDGTRGAATPRELLTKLLAQNSYDLSDQPAVGVTYYDEATNEADFAVWVKEVDTIFDETACGSGTCSIGIALADNKSETTQIDVIQPSGEKITTMAIVDGDSNKITESRISGEVSILFDGRYELK
jgi:diaminopimelate epimerase/ribosomal protein S18 acetylase RimI-like enzyme